MAEAIQLAHERELRVVLNPAPMSPDVVRYPLESVDIFIVNEVEAEGLTGANDWEDAAIRMRERYQDAATVLTLGARGAAYSGPDLQLRESALPVDAIDTTAAGDTFIGFFLAALVQTGDPSKALARGCRAAEICVTRVGAADSIPMQDELSYQQ